MHPRLLPGSGPSPAYRCVSANPNLYATFTSFKKQTMTGQYSISNAFQVTTMCFNFALVSFPFLTN